MSPGDENVFNTPSRKSPDESAEDGIFPVGPTPDRSTSIRTKRNREVDESDYFNSFTPLPNRINASQHEVDEICTGSRRQEAQTRYSQRWASQSEASNSIRELREEHSKLSINQNIPQHLNDLFDQLESLLEPDPSGSRRDFISKSYGVDYSLNSDYHEPSQWLDDDITVAVTLVSDVPFTRFLFNTVKESTMLEKKNALAHDRDAITVIDGAVMFSQSLRDSLECLPADVECVWEFKALKAVFDHYIGALGTQPPFRIVTPEFLTSKEIRDALTDKNAILRLNLGSVNSRFFETGLKIASMQNNKSMKELLMRAASDRLRHITKLVQESVSSGITNQPSTDTDVFGDSLLRRLNKASVTSSTTVSDSQKTGRASIALRTRRTSVVRSTDDISASFLGGLTGRENRYYKDLLSSFGTSPYKSSLLDATVKDIALKKGLDPLEVIGINIFSKDTKDNVDS